MTMFVAFQPRFGICFDVDGVLARGTLAIPAAQKAFKYLLQDEKGDVQAPIVFVTKLTQPKPGQSKSDRIMV